MNRRWAATKTVAYAVLKRAAADDDDDEETRGAKASIKTVASKVKATATEAVKKVAGKAKESDAAEEPNIIDKANDWMNSNPSTIITACLLGVGSTLVVLFGTWAYLRHRTRKLKAEHEAEELEANRAKIEAEKDAQEGPLAVTSETYPHFGASKPPTNVDSTIDSYDDSPTDPHQQAFRRSTKPPGRPENGGGYTMDTISEHTEDPEYTQQIIASPTDIYDEQEDLRDSQVHQGPAYAHQSRQRSYVPSDSMSENVPDYAEAPHRRSLRHPSQPDPRDDYYGSQPGAGMPDPGDIHHGLNISKQSPSGISRSFDRDSVYSLEEKTKYV